MEEAAPLLGSKVNVATQEVVVFVNLSALSYALTPPTPGPAPGPRAPPPGPCLPPSRFRILRRFLTCVVCLSVLVAERNRF